MVGTEKSRGFCAFADGAFDMKGAARHFRSHSEKRDTHSDLPRSTGGEEGVSDSFELFGCHTLTVVAY